MRTDLQPFEAVRHAAKEQDIAKPYHTVILILILSEREAIVSKSLSVQDFGLDAHHAKRNGRGWAEVGGQTGITMYTVILVSQSVS